MYIYIPGAFFPYLSQPTHHHLDRPGPVIVDREVIDSTVASLRSLTSQHAVRVQQVERMEEMQREKLREAEVDMGGHGARLGRNLEGFLRG